MKAPKPTLSSTIFLALSTIPDLILHVFLGVCESYFPERAAVLCMWQFDLHINWAIRRIISSVQRWQKETDVFGGAPPEESVIKMGSKREHCECQVRKTRQSKYENWGIATRCNGSSFLVPMKCNISEFLCSETHFHCVRLQWISPNRFLCLWWRCHNGNANVAAANSI